MPSVFSVIEHSLASLAVPELQQERERAIKAMPSPAKRVGALAIHRFTTTYPKPAQRMVDARLAKHDLTYVGSGYDADVYRRRDSVVKVLRRTAQMTEQDRAAHAQHIHAQNGLLASWMGEFLVPQTTSVDTHPYIPSQRAVQIHQPYRSISDLGLFQTGQPQARPDALAQAIVATPEIVAPLKEFCNRARSFHDHTGAVPDTNGRANVVVTNTPSPEVLLIDGQPIPKEATETVAMIIGQITTLEFALSDY